MTQKEEIIQLINEYIQELIGDTPVSSQLDVGLNHHIHSNYITREEYETLKVQVDKLIELVGDTPVAAQIGAALNR